MHGATVGSIDEPIEGGAPLRLLGWRDGVVPSAGVLRLAGDRGIDGHC
jgi:hypothetical protein